jgi:transposase
VIKLVEEGMSQAEAARRYGVSREAVRKWMRRVERGGQEALAARKRGRPRGGTLKPHQAATIVRCIRERHPDQLRLPFYLWTREAVAQLISRKCGHELSLSTVGRYLRRWGFTAQRPTRRAIEQDPEKIRAWLEEEYPAVQAEARKQRALLLWGDEMGLRSDHIAGRSYAPKGQTPVVSRPGRRFGCNMISAISNRGHLYFSVFEGRFVVAVFREFLTRLLKQTRRKVWLILDRHPVHRAKAIQRWVETKNGRIRIIFMPPYAPELNPDEFLNQDVKTNAVGKQRAANVDELKANTRRHLRSTQRRPDRVRSFFKAPTVKYAS